MDKDILYRYFNNSATDEDIEQVRVWAESSPENRQELFRERRIFDAALLLADDGKRDIEQMQPQQQNRFIRLRIPQFAAMLAVIFALGILAHSQFGRKEDLKTAWYETVAPLGAKSQITLIDGTKVWLNAGSKLLYSNNFGIQNREVTLEGEAYFEVAKNKKLSFDVKTSRLNVKAINTAFNVKDYPNESEIETILIEGKVEVSPIGKTETGKGEVVFLQPRQRLIFKKNTNEILVETEISRKGQAVNPLPKTQIASTVQTVETTADLMVETSWKDKRWRIEIEDLGSFAVKLERRYNVTINFKDNDLPKYKFSGTFEDEPIEEVLKALALAAPVNYALKGNLVTLSRNNAFKEAHRELYKKTW